MVLDLQFQARALKDVEQAQAWYEEQHASLGNNFLGELYAAVNRIRSFPESGLLGKRGRRRMLLRRFPYYVVYREHPKIINVLAVMHFKRKPYQFTVHEG